MGRGEGVLQLFENRKAPSLRSEYYFRVRRWLRNAENLIFSLCIQIKLALDLIKTYIWANEIDILTTGVAHFRENEVSRILENPEYFSEKSAKAKEI